MGDLARVGSGLASMVMPANHDIPDIERQRRIARYAAKEGVSCLTCSDYGTVGKTMEGETEQWGKVKQVFAVPCPDCGGKVETDEQVKARRLRASGLPAPQWGWTLAAWDHTKNPTMEPAFRAAEAFVAHPTTWLVLAGEYGVGKTHLASAVAVALIEENIGVKYTTVLDLMHGARRSVGAGEYQPFLNRWKEAPVIVLDDLGKERMDEAVRAFRDEVVDTILLYRFDNEKPCVVTTNEGKHAFGDRLFSRVQDKSRVVTVTCTGADIRPQKPALQEALA